MHTGKGSSAVVAGFAALLTVGALQAFAAPPHPDVARQIAAGERPLPQYLRELREKGPPKPRGDRSAGKVVRDLKSRQRQGRVLDSFPAPGGGIFDGTAGGAEALLAPPATGPRNVLVLLTQFSDVAATETPGYFDSLVFGAASPSVADYYDEVSGGAFSIVTENLPSTIECDPVVAPCTGATPPGWLPLPGTKAGYKADLRAMAADAVAAVDANLDFSRYDSDGDGFVDYLIVVHVGPGAELNANDAEIWSQTLRVDPIETADGVSIDTFMTVPEYWFPGTFGKMTIGVYAHEFGHLLGLPDLYDLFSYGTFPDSWGIGDWALMSYGMWNGANNRAESPAWMSAWERVALGWATPVVPTADLPDVTFPPVENGGPVYYLWNHGDANSEFFLVENRQRLAGSYDAYLPGQGLLIWHIDETMPDNNTQIYSSNAILRQSDCSWPNHYRVALQQADGYMNLEGKINQGDIGDPYPGSLGITAFSPTSTGEFPPRNPPNSGSYANCDSLVAVRNIAVSGSDILADVEVVARNVAPVALDASVSTPEDTATAIVLEATDDNADPLEYRVVTYPAHGVLDGDPPDLTYTPDENYHGPDSFTFEASDGFVESNLATVSITVTAVNDPPAAADATVSTAEDTSVGITLSATDIESDPLTYAVVAWPVHGSLSGTPPDLTYTPDADYYGADSFTFVANDGAADSNVATVSITVTAVNDPPVALDALVDTAEDTPVAVTLSATDIESDPLTYEVVTPPAHGILSGAPPNLTYTPGADYHGADSLTFKANDGVADSNVATVSITVTPVNDAPVLEPVGDRIATEGVPLSFALLASDADGDPLEYFIAGVPPDGAALDPATGAFTWTPRFDQAGSYVVTFRVGDGALYDEETVTITIGEPAGPIFADDFTVVAASKPKWTVVTGNWSWSAANRNLVATSLTKTNLVRVAQLDPLALPLGVGAMRASVKLAPQAGRLGPNGMIVFAYRDPTHYRWVKVTPSSLQIGQTGELDGIPGGVKRSVRSAQALNRAVLLTVKVHATGRVEVFKGTAKTPAASYVFRAGTAPSVVPGGVGLGSVRARTIFDSVRVWENSFLGE